MMHEFGFTTGMHAFSNGFSFSIISYNLLLVHGRIQHHFRNIGSQITLIIMIIVTKLVFSSISRFRFLIFEFQLIFYLQILSSHFSTFELNFSVYVFLEIIQLATYNLATPQISARRK